VLVGYRIGQLVPYVMGEVRAGKVEDDPFFFPDPAQPSVLIGRFPGRERGDRLRPVRRPDRLSGVGAGVQLRLLRDAVKTEKVSQRRRCVLG